MATYLHYQIWTQLYDVPKVSDGRLIEEIASGTIPLSSSMSAVIQIPPGSSGYQLAGIFQVKGTDAAYLHLRRGGETPPAGTGAHAAVDAQPRALIDANDGAIRVPLPSGGTFAAVQSAALA